MKSAVGSAAVAACALARSMNVTDLGRVQAPVKLIQKQAPSIRAGPQPARPKRGSAASVLEGEVGSQLRVSPTDEVAQHETTQPHRRVVPSWS